MRWNSLFHTKFLIGRARIAFVLGLQLASLMAIGLPLKTQALETSVGNQSLTKALPPLPENEYPPVTVSDTATEGGGKRGCGPLGDEQYRPIALAPSVYRHGGYTTLSQPMLWFYLPFEITTEPRDAQTIQLILEQPVELEQPLTPELASSPEIELTQVFERAISAPSLQRGFVAIPLADTDVSIEPNTAFVWTVKIHCGDPEDVEDSDDLAVDQAWVAHVGSSPLSQPIPEGTVALSLSEAYRDSGLWYDALNTLGIELLQPVSTEEASAVATLAELQGAWQQLLIDGGFESLSSETTVQVLDFMSEDAAE